MHHNPAPRPVCALAAFILAAAASLASGDAPPTPSPTGFPEQRVCDNTGGALYAIDGPNAALSTSTTVWGLTLFFPEVSRVPAKRRPSVVQRVSNVPCSTAPRPTLHAGPAHTPCRPYQSHFLRPLMRRRLR